MMLAAIVLPTVLAAGLFFAAQPELRPIDAGTEDVSVNSQSRLVPRVDQRQPVGFDQVFELTKPNGERVFIRRSGNLYAEFERSVYTDSGSPDIPPGTIFRLGDPTREVPTEVAPAPNRVSLRVSMDARERSNASGSDGQATRAAGPIARAVGEPSIMGNELYRQVRISQLLMAAVKSETSKP